MSVQTFYPISSGSFQVEEKEGKRYRYAFNDLRLYNRFEYIQELFREKQSSTLQKLGWSYAEVVGLQRFVNNPKVELSELIHELTRIDEEQIAGLDLIIPIDTTIVSMSSKKLTLPDFIDKLGIGGNNTSSGLHCTPSLIIDEKSEAILGLGDIVTHKVPKGSDDAKVNKSMRRMRHKLPFEQRASSIWSVCCKNTTNKLKGAKSLTYLIDQGGDSAESYFVILKEPKQNLIVRADLSHDRTIVTLDGKEMSLSEYASTLEICSTKVVKIRELNHWSRTNNKQVQRKKRNALLHLKFGVVQIKKTSSCSESCPEIDRIITFVEVKEDPSTVPAGEDPIHWGLLTSCPVETIEDAWQVVNNYCKRWNIEQLFRVVKTKGFDIEHTQLKNPEAVKKLTVMAMKSAIEAMQLVAARNNVELSADLLFDEDERIILESLSSELDGNTIKQQNPYPKQSLAWAAWIIARLGGWTGCEYHRPPGPITMTNGLEKFRAQVWAIKLIIPNLRM